MGAATVPLEVARLPLGTILYDSIALHVRGCRCAHDEHRAGFARPTGHRLLGEAERCAEAVLSDARLPKAPPGRARS